MSDGADTDNLAVYIIIPALIIIFALWWLFRYCSRDEEYADIYVDGSNVAKQYGNGQFKVKGIENCLIYFKENQSGKIVKVVLPSFRGQKSKTDDPRLMKKLIGENKIFLVKEAGKNADDLYMIRQAVKNHSYIVSNDQFREFYDPNDTNKCELFNNRCIEFFFTRTGDFKEKGFTV